MAKKSEISVINFNTMGLFNFDSVQGFLTSARVRQRQEKIAELLSKDDADIIALQEVHTYSFLNILKSKLKNHEYIAYRKLLYGPRGSLVIFSKLPLESIDYVDFTDRGTIFNTSIVAILRRSGMQVVKLKGKNTYLINAHLTQNGDFVWNKKSRFYPYIRSQLSQITKKIRDLSIQNSPSIIVLGDFNTDRKSTLYNSFVRISELTDLFGSKKTPTMHQEFLPSKKSARRIDYIFLRKNQQSVKVKKTAELFKEKVLLGKSRMNYLSDHICQKAILEF